MTQRPSVTDSAVNDLIAAEGMLSGPTAGTLSYDLDSGRVVGSPVDPEVAKKQQTQIREMLGTARRLRRVIHPTLVQLAALNELGSPVWLLTLDAAKVADGIVWADDLGLRSLAHSLGIKTFGTWSLVSLVYKHNRITAEQLSAVERRLIVEYVVDLPFDSAALMSVAEEDEWRPRAVATVLSRPAAWIDLQATIALFRAIYRQASDESLPTWAHAAVNGLTAASVPERRIENLTMLTAIALGDSWSRPTHTSAVVQAVTRLAPDQAVEITQQALSSVWKYMKDQYGSQDASMVFLHVIGSLDDQYRQFGVGLILRRDT